jgi:hypothetical protein
MQIPGKWIDDMVEANIQRILKEKEIKAQEHQSPIQTRFGALYYETPYRGESTCSFCDGSCGYIRGTKHESQYQDDHNEQPKS